MSNYIYGLLHSPDYRERFKNNLAKQLPRIPAVKGFDDFKAFRDAGRALGRLHVNFETVEPYMVSFKEGDHRLIPEAEANPKNFYRVKKMKFGGKGKNKDKTTVIYNDNITMQNIPLEAYDYVVNGKSALEWVMERQVVKTDGASGIVNDANDYANETVGDPKYPLELFQRVITVSLETMRIVSELPRLQINAEGEEGATDQTVDGIRAGIKEVWGDSPATSLALSVIDAIEKRGLSAHEPLRISDILEMLDLPKLSGDLISALAILAQSEFAILQPGGKFVDEDGKLHPLAPEEFQRALSLDTVIHPLTNEHVNEATHKVIPVFSLSKELFAGSEK